MDEVKDEQQLPGSFSADLLSGSGSKCKGTNEITFYSPNDTKNQLIYLNYFNVNPLGNSPFYIF